MAGLLTGCPSAYSGNNDSTTDTATDTTAPTAPTVISLTTDSTTPVITGTFDASDYAGGFTVQLNGITYTLGTDSELTRTGNTWSLTIPAGSELPLNTYDVVATATDDSGNAATDTTTNELVIADLTAPTITSTTPADADATVLLDATIKVTFSEPMDTNTITTTSFTVDNSVSGTLSFNSDNTVATFTPSTNFTNYTTYTVSLDNTITDSAGNAITASSFSFTAAVWQGSKEFGTAGKSTFGTDIMTGSNDSVYAIGVTSDSLNGETITGTQDTYLIHYNAVGQRQWTRLLGVTGTSTGSQAIAHDSNNNLYIVGDAQGDLDGNTLTGTMDGYLSKFSADGTKQWTKLVGVSSKSVQGLAVATDTNDNVYVAWRTSGALHGNTQTGSNDFALTKYDASGTRQWTQQLGATSSDTLPYDIAIDSNANIYVFGQTNGNLDGNTLAGTQDGFITKYDTGGVKQWTVQIGDSGLWLYAKAIAIDSNDNLFVTGFLNTGASLYGEPLTGTSDGFLIKYDNTGTRQWVALQGLSGSSAYNYGITTDSADNIYVGGTTYAAFTGNTLTGAADGTLIKYDTNGTRQWVMQFGTASLETSVNAITANSHDELFSTGMIDEGLFPPVSAGVVSKHDSSGTLQ